MFGFVTVNPEALTLEEKDRYLSVYCGICHTLGHRFGQRTRLTLSHDMTFMALLHLSLYEEPELQEESGCAFHPLSKRIWSTNKYIEYASDMTVLLMYYKMLDDWNDDQKIAAKVAANLLEDAYVEIEQRYPRQTQALDKGLARISQLESSINRTNEDCDLVANTFGAIMGELFAVNDDFWSYDLRRFGAHLGRFIYMADAAVDLEKDIKTGSYNPFIGHDLTKEDRETLLMSYMETTTDLFERLPLEQDISLLRNVMYSGVWGSYNAHLLKNKEQIVDYSCEDFDEHLQFESSNDLQSVYI